MQALEQIEDPRRPSNGTLHDLREILVIAICAVLSDAESFEDIAAWGQAKLAWLRRFLTLKNGIPSEDTFLRVFRLIDPKQFEAAFRTWTAGLLPALERAESEKEGPDTIAIDGKTVRGSGRGGCQAIHMVSAFATRHGLVLGQEKVDAKSNEITAIPLLLESLYLKGLLVSIDAMGCQREIVQHILKKEGDYLLAVKGNQPSLERAVESAVIEQGERAEPHRTVMTAHGRDVVQQARVIPAVDWVDTSLWPGCKTIGVIDSMRKVGDKPAEWERRYYISSRELSAEELAQAVRSHWGIENQLHWMLDVGFGEDASMVRKDHAPQNLSLLRKIVLNLVRGVPMGKNGKMSMRLKRKAAAWEDDARAMLLGLTLV
jgi:predicted transposase YbfD/YdcC